MGPTDPPHARPPRPQQPAFAFQCDACGASSDREEAYQVVERRWGRATTHCLPCASLKAVRAGGRAERWAVALGALSLCILWLTDDTTLTHFAWAYVNLGLLPMLLVLPTLVLHELGHYGVARILGLPVHDVQIGSGATLWSGRLADVPIRWLRYPILGQVRVSLQDSSWGRLRLASVVAAGPATHVVWIASACWAAHLFGVLGEGTWGVGPLTDRFNPFSSIIFLNALSLLINLIPARYGTATTDGALLLALPFLDREQVDGLVESRWATPAELALAVGDWEGAERDIRAGLDHSPDSLVLNLLLGCLYSQQARHGQAVLILRALYAREGLDAVGRAAIANALAWCLCQIDDPADLDERDARLLEAQRQLGEQPAVLSTRGACLLTDGRPSEAWPLLANALSKLEDAEHRATVLCSLARAEHQLGLAEQARTRLVAARALSPRNALLDRTERELSRAPGPPSDSRPARSTAQSLELPRYESKLAERSRRRAPRWLWIAVPACLLLYSCGPPFMESALTMDVPYHDLVQGPATDEESAACSVGLATLQRWSWLLSRLPDSGYPGWSSWRAARAAHLEACAGNLERAHAMLSGLLVREMAMLGSAGLAEPNAEDGDTSWDRYLVALAAFDHAVALVHLDERLGRPEAADATHTRVERLARRIDEAGPERPQFDYRARVARLMADMIERRDGPAAALAHVDEVLRSVEDVHPDPQLVPLLTLQAELLERLGRADEAGATWARIGRAGRDVYAMRPPESRTGYPVDDAAH